MKSICYVTLLRLLRFDAKCLILRQLAHIQTVLRIGAWNDSLFVLFILLLFFNSVYKYTKNQRDTQILVKIPKLDIS